MGSTRRDVRTQSWRLAPGVGTCLRQQLLAFSVLLKARGVPRIAGNVASPLPSMQASQTFQRELLRCGVGHGGRSLGARGNELTRGGGGELDTACIEALELPREGGELGAACAEDLPSSSASRADCKSSRVSFM